MLIPLISACHAPLPEYAWRDAETAVRQMSERAAQVHTVESGVRLMLTSKEGESVTLDGAIVAAPPDHFRLRAWKMGHAVFDFTLTPDGAWLKAEESPWDAGRAPPPGFRSVKPRVIADAWAMFAGGMFDPGAPDGRQAEVIDNGGPWFTLRRTIKDSGALDQTGVLTVACEIDRRTLTARRYRIIDSSGVERATLSLEEYRDFGGVVFPTRLGASGPDGTVLILLDSPEFNLPTAPDAFVPPPGAARQP
jgi:hypothetical protein